MTYFDQFHWACLLCFVWKTTLVNLVFSIIHPYKGRLQGSNAAFKGAAATTEPQNSCIMYYIDWTAALFSRYLRQSDGMVYKLLKMEKNRPKRRKLYIDFASTHFHWNFKSKWNKKQQCFKQFGLCMCHIVSKRVLLFASSLHLALFDIWKSL